MNFKKIVCTIFLATTCILAGCGNSSSLNSNSDHHTCSPDNISDMNSEESKLDNSDSTNSTTGLSDSETAYEYINSKGDTLETRINPPEGYTRIDQSEGSFANFLRTYKMKPDGSPVLLYDERQKGNQNVHVAVFELPIENEDLQQCADSIMRIIGEYYYSSGQIDKINFTLGGGFIADFEKWSQGNGISLSNDKLVWTSSSGNDTSYDSFKKFMRIVFAYSGTLNMDADSDAIDLEDIQVGDIFIKGGSPGHVVMITDICENENHKKAFLLAQGYMPAQEFHVIKNPLHEEDPWYYVDEITYPFQTAEYTFEEGSIKRYNRIND